MSPFYRTLVLVGGVFALFTVLLVLFVLTYSDRIIEYNKIKGDAQSYNRLNNVPIIDMADSYDRTKTRVSVGTSSFVLPCHQLGNVEEHTGIDIWSVTSCTWKIGILSPVKHAISNEDIDVVGSLSNSYESGGIMDLVAHIYNIDEQLAAEFLITTYYGQRMMLETSSVGMLDLLMMSHDEAEIYLVAASHKSSNKKNSGLIEFVNTPYGYAIVRSDYIDGGAEAEFMIWSADQSVGQTVGIRSIDGDPIDIDELRQFVASYRLED